MSELFQLKPCEECNGTGDAHSQGHDYDCPDCLGTGHEEPAKRIMNLELMLNQHKETLKSSDAHNNELAQQLEIAREQRDRLAEALRKIKNEQPT
jgi:Zn-finger protein